MREELLCTNRDEFRRWLTANGSVSNGIWLVFGKSGQLQTVKPDEALEEALCFGWIDGQISSVDEAKYIKKFTPRRKGSKWSARNRGIAGKLIEQGQMSEQGFAAIAQAKRDGTWETPEAEPISDAQIAMLVDALRGHEPAATNFAKMPPSVRRTYTAHYLNAKAEKTRASRLEQIIGRLNENKRPM